MNRRIINTNIRLNLAHEADRKAWEYLQRLDRKAYKSYSCAVVTALNDFFGRQEQSNQESLREEAFWQKLQAVIRQELQSAAPAYGLMQILQGSLPPAASPTPPADAAEQEEMNDVALDYVNSF